MLLYGIPLSACISLVYCATRYEMPQRILATSVLMFVKIVAGLSALYAVLWYVSR
ncbi:MAG: hypothetical protein KDA91_18915 [Planctomycetaceae bacterium]|nr:hypothetical protein [Planctomycetaceae bacterium]